VVTAAHCAPEHHFKVTGLPYDSDNHRIGCHNVTDRDNCNKRINVTQWIKHPEYDVSGQQEDDFSLILLQSSAEGVPLVKLNQDESYPTNDMISRVMGWGDTIFNGELSDILLEVDLPLLSNAQCYLCNSVYDLKMIGKNKLCTYLPGKDSCQGDSGKIL
jgi:secreted trypsin-like serine protease